MSAREITANPSRAAPSVLARINKCLRKRNGTGAGLLMNGRRDFDLKTVGAAAEHAILGFAYLHHGVGEPQPASDQKQHDYPAIAFIIIR